MSMSGDHTGRPTGSPAGWYQDPSGQPGLRWWDGLQWTSHTQSAQGAAASASESTGTPDRFIDPGPGRPGVIPQADTGSTPGGFKSEKRTTTTLTGRKVAVIGGICLIVAIVVATLIGKGAQPSQDHGKIAPHCYIGAADTQGNILTISVLGDSDCTNVAGWIEANTTLGSVAIFTPNTGKGPGTAVCMGMLDGYPATVINPIDNPDNALCLTFGFGPMP